MKSYSASHTITVENNGLKIVSDSFPSELSACYAQADITAEITGKMWISCNASTNGAVQDLGMSIAVNDVSQQLCRGEGRLSEAINVNKGDTVTLKFYSHIGTKEANTLYYKDIIVQYETLTNYVPYVENIISIKNVENTIVLDGSGGIGDYTTNSTAMGGTDYRFTYNTDITDALDGVLPANSNTVAKVQVNGIQLKTYNETHNNQIGIGIGATGKISIYIGNGCNNRNLLIDYLASNPITIKYPTTNTGFVGIDKNVKVSTGYIIKSDENFSVTYSCLKNDQEYSVVCFGDSITGMFTNETDYPSMISRKSNIVAYNVGFSGCQWTDHSNSKNQPFSMNRLVDAICENDFSTQDANAIAGGETYPERLATLKSIDFSQIDCVTILYGTNDWATNKTLLSALDSNISEKQRTNVEDSVEYSINKLKATYPNLEIIVLTPFWRRLSGNDSDTTPNSNGVYLNEFSNLIETVAKNKCNVETINLYNELDINMANCLKYLPDGTHPNEKLKNIIADIIIAKINN